MQATSIKEFDESLIRFEKDRKSFLPVSVLYGPNGGGKTNVLKAFRTLKTIIVKPIILYKEGDVSVNSLSKEMFFKFDSEKRKQPSEFEVFFRKGKDEFRYNLCIFENKIVEEYLYRLTIGAKKPEMIFARYEGTIEIGKELKTAKVSTAVNEEMPFLSFLGIFHNIGAIDTVVEWFTTSLYLDNSDVESEVLLEVLKEDGFLKKDIFLDMLSSLDINVKDYRYFEEKGFFTKHVVKGEEFELAFEEESKGTKKLFALLPFAIAVLANGSLLIVDELDCRLHPKLLRYIINLFTDPSVNRNGAQLIFTSHDLSTMKGSIFRRDEIWFAAKDASESSQIYSLYDIRDEKNEHVKSTAAFDKQYMEGRYGADPYLKKMLDWEVPEHEQKATEEK